MAQGMENKTILVTGGCGYLGSQLIRSLAEDGYLRNSTIRILDNFHRGHIQALYNLPDNCTYQLIEADLLDPNAVQFALQDADAVIHLAALVRSPMSFEHPSWVEQVNHWGTTRLIEACLNADVKRFIYVSTAAVYGPGGIFTESDPPRPIGPYASSKRKAEVATLSAIERGLEPTILRFGTIYGCAPVIRYNAMVNRFAYLAGTKRPLTIYGQGTQRRPIIHVQDACRAICHALENPEKTVNETFNAASQNASVHEIAAAVQANLPEATTRYTEQDVVNHFSFEISNQQLLDTGWQPQVSLQDGLQELITRFVNLEPSLTMP